MMTLTRWNPLRESLAARRAFEEAWHDFDNRLAFAAPAMDILNYDDYVEVRVNLPGVDPENINVEVKEGLLNIAANVNTDQSHESGNYTYRERYQGSYQRSLRLPDTIDPQNTEASFENGVLTLKLNKKPEAQPIRIPVSGIGKPENGKK